MRAEVVAVDTRIRLLQHNHISTLPRTLREEVMYDEAEQAQQSLARMVLLNNGQRAVLDHALHVIDNGPDENHPATIFMQADAGCGKTFTFNALLAAVRGRGHVALAVATSGIGATLMEGGRTALNINSLSLASLIAIVGIAIQATRPSFYAKLSLLHGMRHQWRTVTTSSA